MIFHEKAWVNRIFLFLCRWYSRSKQSDEVTIFGKKPQAKVYLTHDVDYISKTNPLRLKKTVFNLFNLSQSIANRERGLSSKVKDIFKFPLNKQDYWEFDQISDLEEKIRAKSCWNFYSRPSGKRSFSPKLKLLDPSYDIANQNFLKR